MLVKARFDSNEKFVLDRIGTKAKKVGQTSASHAPSKKQLKPSLHLLHKGSRKFAAFARELLARFCLTDEDLKALKIGRFRLQGEVHMWMYDRYSLARMLDEAGFKEPRQQNAHESAIENWTSYNLDTEPDGTVCKPDSLFMEAFK